MTSLRTMVFAGLVVLVAGTNLCAEESAPRLFVLAVGVSKYPKPDALNYAHRDATEVAAAFKQHSKKLFDSIETRVLTDENATRAAILEGLDWLRKNATAKDIGVFYFAGLGVKDGKATFLLPVDGNKEQLEKSAVGADEFAKRVKEAKGQLIVILDASQAGRFASTLADDPNAPERGVAMICAAVGEQDARESNEHKHGLFTVAILDAISGKGEGLRNKDGVISFKELEAFVALRVRVLSAGRQNPVSSVPRAFRDFPISKP